MQGTEIVFATTPARGTGRLRDRTGRSGACRNRSGARLPSPSRAARRPIARRDGGTRGGRVRTERPDGTARSGLWGAPGR